MSTERWRAISDWHNTWLSAPSDARAQLRASFAIDHPELLQLADKLTASSDPVDGFLETPALVARCSRSGAGGSLASLKAR